MSYQSRLDALEAERQKLQNLIAACHHEYGPIKYDPEKKPEIKYEEDYHIGTEYFYKEVPTGRTIIIPRWSHECKLCGFIEYTKDYEEGPVLKMPVFKSDR